MQAFHYPPGTVLGINCGLYSHKGIAGDRLLNGQQTVIHNSKRLGAVTEEAWDQFAAGKAVFAIERPSSIFAEHILVNARARVGQGWRLLDNNCEHFVEECCGRVKRSDQVRVWMGALAIFFIARVNA